MLAEFWQHFFSPLLSNLFLISFSCVFISFSLLLQLVHISFLSFFLHSFSLLSFPLSRFHHYFVLFIFLFDCFCLQVCLVTLPQMSASSSDSRVRHPLYHSYSPRSRSHSRHSRSDSRRSPSHSRRSPSHFSRSPSHYRRSPSHSCSPVRSHPVTRSHLSHSPSRSRSPTSIQMPTTQISLRIEDVLKGQQNILTQQQQLLDEFTNISCRLNEIQECFLDALSPKYEVLVASCRLWSFFFFLFYFHFISLLFFFFFIFIFFLFLWN